MRDKDPTRPVVSVLGDGDFLQGVTALWTARALQHSRSVHRLEQPLQLQRRDPSGSGCQDARPSA